MVSSLEDAKRSQPRQARWPLAFVTMSRPDIQVKSRQAVPTTVVADGAKQTTHDNTL